MQVCGQGQILIIVNMYTGELWNVLASTGEARLIDLGGALLIGGDGLVSRRSGAECTQLNSKHNIFFCV